LHSRTTTEVEAALYVVATPIGNLRDITLRALDTLGQVNLVAAEDTRVARRLLAHYGIDVPLMALHEHNEARAAERVIEALERGRSVAVVCDSGTPAISDPGALLVQRVRSAGCRIIPVPGPSALTAALSVAGIPAAPVLFWGFLPARDSARRETLSRLAGIECTLVFFEAPHRIRETLAALNETLGAERRVVVARELSKLFESIHACALGEAVDWLDQDDNRSRGEFVLIVHGATAARAAGADEAEQRRVLGILLAELPLAKAAALAAQITGARKRALYAAGLEIAARSARPARASSARGRSRRG
jgi:16S rRNA (cytidine1402-2'-O)-methyltransferase